MEKNTTQKDLDWLEKEMKKDQLEVENYKNQMIRQLKMMKKEDLFVPPPKKSKINLLFNKIKNLLGL